MERHSLTEFLDHFVWLGDECAYVQRVGYRTVRHSYAEVASTAFRFARELEARGIGKGDPVMIWGANCAEWVAVFFGCALRGAVVVPMDDVASQDFALRVYQQVGAKLLVCSLEHLSASVPALIFEDLTATLSGYSSAPYPAAAIGPEDTLQIVFTSGTTSEPRGVVITHGNVLANIVPLEAEIRKYLKWEWLVHPVRFLNLLPLSHVFGQFLGIFLPQIMGGTVVFQSSLKPSEVIATVHREKVSVVVAVPRVLQSLKEKLERDIEEQGRLAAFQQKFRSAAGKHFLRRWWIFRGVRRKFGWKFWAFISGGAALDSVTEEFWGRLGYAAIQGYGLTETTSLVSVNHPFRLGKGSIGKVLAGREVKLATDGEILVRGRGVASTYWHENTRTPVAGEEGWYHTGDIGALDAAANLYFKGRKKDVIVTPAGMKVYPEDLEAELRRQPETKDCVVVALPRQGNAEACAVLILRTGADAQSVVQRANAALAEFQRIRQWFVWTEPDFPRTSTQKPRTQEVLAAVMAERSGPLNAGHSAAPLAELIRRITGRPVAGLSTNANLEADLGLSSLDRVELLSALEDRYQADLTETGFAAVNTVGDIERLLQGKSAGRTSYHYPRWVQHWPVTWVRLTAEYLLLLPAVFVLGRPRIVGRENLRQVKGPVLVVCNHISDVDFGFVLAALPPRLRNRLAIATRGEALEALRTPAVDRGFVAGLYDRVKWTLGVALLNLFPLPREAGFRDSFVYAGESVDHRYSVLIFPEGRHTKDGKMVSFRAGIGLLANDLRIPVVPMRIDGLFELQQSGKRIAPPGAITVSVGRPVSFDGNHDAESITRELQEKVSAL